MSTPGAENPMSSNEPVAVSILDREFLIACAAEEQAGLLAAARHLDARMREMRTSMRTASMDRFAIMAALNASHELLAERARSARLAEQLRALDARLERAFDTSVQ
ncbi:cell division protein ZapA [Dokdonella sp.]|uniref:cell division protein ZapA n=1 Tax=Dokdonella sp. TaxID=2291710 RepID=UPI0031C2D402|nr:cell division protein ZapA [Dokdonella sp.]